MMQSTNTIPTSMLAGIYVGKGKVDVQEIPVPRVGPKEILLRVYTCGVCPTDLKKIQNGSLKPPLIFGHEIAGTIVKIGWSVKEWKMGDRVSVYHHIPCNNCTYCRSKDYAQCKGYKKVGTTAGYEPAGGGFSEYILIKDWIVKKGLTKIPSNISFDEASFIEPVNTCLKGIEKLDIKKGETVLILGQGPVGLMLLQLALVKQAKTIVLDPLKVRLRKAKSLGCQFMLQPLNGRWMKKVLSLTRQHGVDISITATANKQALQEAIKVTRRGGKILLFSQTQKENYIPIDVGDLCVSDKTIIGSYSADVDLNRKSSELIFKRKIKVKELISHTFDLSQFKKAIRLANHPTQNSLKVLIHPKRVSS